MPAPAVSVQFSTVALDKALVAASSAKAVKLYNYLLDKMCIRDRYTYHSFLIGIFHFISG